MPPLLTQILLKLITVGLTALCTWLSIKPDALGLDQAANWVLTIALGLIGLATFALSTWRHKAALDENVAHRLDDVYRAIAAKQPNQPGWIAPTDPPTPQPVPKT